MTPSPRSGPKYLIRIDDICPGMDWRLWEPLEALLLKYGVSPILAVVPDNQDPSLDACPPAPDFWERVRGWQARGWTIGLHGYQHLYVNQESGILGMNPASEFAGLPYREQHAKLSRGLERFAQEGVRAETFVAPGHSFDWFTVRALADLGIRTLSDGFALGPYRDIQGTTWVPQQFALLRPMPRGTWTFCYHPNHIAPFMASLERNLELLHPHMITFQEAVAQGTEPRTVADRLVSLARGTLAGLRKLRF